MDWIKYKKHPNTHIMSAIIENLPDELILIIRDYVLDLDTRINILLLIISKIEPSANIRTLFSKFTGTKIRDIWNLSRDKIFEPNRNTFTTNMKSVMPPPITYRYGNLPPAWTPPNTTINRPYTDHSIQHPIINQITHWGASKKLGIQKSKRAGVLEEYTYFLIYTKINYTPFDNTLRQMAYNILAGSLILYKEIQRIPVKVNIWNIRYLERKAAAEAAEAAALAFPSSNV